MVQTSFRTQSTPQKTFRFIASGDAMELFQGSSLVPGIEEVRVQNREIFVRDSWGFSHREFIAQIQEPSNLVFHIEPNKLLGLFIKSLCEEWRFTGAGAGTLVERTFSLIPQKWAAPLLPLLERKLKQAIIANNETLSFHLLLRRDHLNKPLPLKAPKS